MLEMLNQKFKLKTHQAIFTQVLIRVEIYQKLCCLT